MKRLQVRDEPTDRLPGEVVAAFFFADERPLQGPAGLLDWRLNGWLTARLLSGHAVGRPGEFVLLGNNGKLQASWALFAGGGALGELTPLTCAGLVGCLLETVRLAGFRRIGLALPHLAGMSSQEVERMVWDILEQNRYRGMHVIVTCRGARG
jgi:hypothetical protein